MGKYVGHHSRARVERAMQLFLCAAVSTQILGKNLDYISDEGY